MEMAAKAAPDDRVPLMATNGIATIMTMNPVEVIARMRSDRLCALAVGRDKRVGLLPSVPPVVDAGLP
jgi:tripartite-type tricarboxylate transporter receptor subunit TctC